MSSSTRVEYRQLGKSGLRVSVPILGCMGFGSKEWAQWTLDEEQSFEILQAAWDMGINTFDTANNYSNGESERILGKWIAKSNIPRERIIVATKCYALVGHTPEIWAQFTPELKQQRDYVNQSGLSRAAIFNAVQASLTRLNLTYIDLYQIHRFDPETPAEETMKALHDLVESGKVRYIGASSMRAWQFAYLNEVAEKHGWTKFVSMQNEYSLLYREEEREMNAHCNFNGIGLIPWSPLGGGDLARPLNTDTARSEHMKVKLARYYPNLTDTDEQIVRRVEEVAAKRGLKMAQVAVAWVAGKVASPKTRSSILDMNRSEFAATHSTPWLRPVAFSLLGIACHWSCLPHCAGITAFHYSLRRVLDCVFSMAERSRQHGSIAQTGTSPHEVTPHG